MVVDLDIAGSGLFGTSTRLPDGTLARSGFEALSKYDENRDGIINEKNEVYSELLYGRIKTVTTDWKKRN